MLEGWLIRLMLHSLEVRSVSNLKFAFFAEQPYDSIPNFTAADVLRLTGIGRNEFIDIMNKCRAKVILNVFFVSSSPTRNFKADVACFSV